MVILERSTARNEVSVPPIKKNSTIVILEEQIHTRRLEIKRLSASLQMFGTLHVNGLTDNDNFSAERANLVNRMLELNRKQHLDRKQLRPHKRAKEAKRKSPFKQAVNRNYPTESTSGLKTVPLETRTEPVVLFEKTRRRQKDPLTDEITQIIQQLTNLGIQKKEQKLTPEEYQQLSKPLGHKLHELEEQVKHNRIKKY